MIADHAPSLIQIIAVLVVAVVLVAFVIALLTAPLDPDEQVSAEHLAELNREDF